MFRYQFVVICHVMAIWKTIVGVMLGLMLVGIVAEAANNTQMIKGSNFSFTLPDHSWQAPDRIDPQVSVDLVNNKLQSRIKFAVRNYESPLSVFNKDIIALIIDPGIIAPDTASLISNQLLVINGNKYYRVDIIIHKENNSDIEILDWMTVKNKRGYQFCCGGPKDNNSRTIPLDKVCGDIAATLMVK